MDAQPAGHSDLGVLLGQGPTAQLQGGNVGHPKSAEHLHTPAEHPVLDWGIEDYTKTKLLPSCKPCGCFGFLLGQACMTAGHPHILLGQYPAAKLIGEP